MEKKALSTKNRKKISNFLFYIALTTELLFMVLEKSEVTIPFISHVFRITFLFTLAAVVINKHYRKEWFIIAAVIGFTFICYKITGRNELLRFSMFIIAAKDVDLEKTMKYWFYFCLAGFSIILLLSLAGIMGDIYVEADFGRGCLERRYVFGFGHPNTLCGCIYAILLLWIWIYGKKSRMVAYVAWIIGSVALYKLSLSRTIILVFMITIGLALLIRLSSMIGEMKITYIVSAIISPILCVAVSIIAAIVSKYRWYVEPNGIGWHDGNKYVVRLDEVLNNRISNLYYDSDMHEGAIETWKLFSDRNSNGIFDMGWVRLFYWYGIIPASLVVIFLILLIYACYKKRDIWTVLIVISMGIYTVIEATFVSRYIGRNILLPIIAVYFYEFLLGTHDASNHVRGK